MREVVVALKQREWQKPLVKAFREGKRHGIVIAHRRAGKDRVSLFIELEQALKQRCEVWHALPEQEQARKVVWDAITKDGQKLIDAAFPPDIVAGRSESEMKLTLKNGSLWRLVGADRFNALVGSNPRHVTMSEFALTNPQAREFIRPILAENGGSELLITTPRGYNHAHEVLKHAQQSDAWYWGIHPVSQTKLIPDDVLAEERASMPDELYRQEYECDFSAANIGAILGRYIEEAERDGRIGTEDAYYDNGAPLHVSSDIGYRDAAAFWFWQPRPGGFAMVDYWTGTGMDADDWIDRFRTVGYPLDTLWLPHDARAKTFAGKRTVVEQFLSAGVAKTVRVTPAAKIADRINAARVIARKTRWSPDCEEGLKALRAWSFKYDLETKAFSAEPQHDWASHGGDAFSYFAVTALPGATSAAKVSPQRAARSAHYAFNLDQLWDDPRVNVRMEAE